jgi:hypothetical protein
MDKSYFARISSLDTPLIVIPDTLERLVAWLIAEKLMRLDPGAGDAELVAGVESADPPSVARRIAFDVEPDPKWQIKGQCLYEFFVLAGFTLSLKGSSSSYGTPAYNDLRRRIGLPLVRPCGGPAAEEGSKADVAP